MLQPSGIIPAMVTPFHADESLNFEATGQLLDHLIGLGVHGIFILGSNGEFHVLGEAEKVAFAQYVIQKVNHRVPVYVGVGACGTLETIRLAKKMEALGADALSVITPYFIAPTQSELITHYTRIAEAVSLPIILYNIPKNTGISIAPETVRQLATLPNIIGIKDSSGDMELMKQYLEAAQGQTFTALVGSDSKISKAIRLGAKGAIAGTANVITRHDLDLYDALMAHDDAQADRLQEGIDVLRNVLKLGTVPSVLKRAVTLMGIDVGAARGPVVSCSEDADQKIREALSYYHLL